MKSIRQTRQFRFHFTPHKFMFTARVDFDIFDVVIDGWVSIGGTTTVAADICTRAIALRFFVVFVVAAAWIGAFRCAVVRCTVAEHFTFIKSLQIAGWVFVVLNDGGRERRQTDGKWKKNVCVKTVSVVRIYIVKHKARWAFSHTWMTRCRCTICRRTDAKWMFAEDYPLPDSVSERKHSGLSSQRRVWMCRRPQLPSRIDQRNARWRPPWTLLRGSKSLASGASWCFRQSQWEMWQELCNFLPFPERSCRYRLLDCRLW